MKKNKKILLISGTSKGLGRDLLKYFVKGYKFSVMEIFLIDTND